MTNNNTLIVPISDMHSGGSTALLPAHEIVFTYGTVIPKPKQIEMYDHWLYCAQRVKLARKKKRLIVVNLGDGIDGAHHGSLEAVTFLPNEQAKIHIELMQTFLDICGFGRDDELHYARGTYVHVGETEKDIAEKLGGTFHDEIELNVNGRNLSFVHHGPSAGKGSNRGNALRNWLKGIFYDCQAEGSTIPDYVITSHTHDPDWGDYIGRVDGKYHKIHGLICPSWQAKTRYALGKVPKKRNKIGLQYLEITKDGLIGDPVELLM